MNWWYTLVDLLPFEWAEPGSMYFMKNALLAILVISPLFGLLSTMVVEKKMSFFSDALGHSAFTGIAAGTLAGFADPSICAVALAVCFALLFTWVRSRTTLASDTVIGVFSSTAVALGIFLSTLGGRSFTRFNSLLVGDILSVTPGRIALLALILAAVLLLWWFGLNQLTLSAIHPALARSRGIHLERQDALFNCAVAVVVTLTMTWVGLLVINSLLILPGAAARNLARNLRQYTVISLLAALVSGVAGLMMSYYIGASAGASITLVLAALFCLTLALRERALS
ncbi:MAG TPA: metal ABC transporter permease [Candidatus Onthomonas avicola]|nr:metal ABC transporter permease [Candidatus Onthomonas avicola]